MTATIISSSVKNLRSEIRTVDNGVAERRSLLLMAPRRVGWVTEELPGYFDVVRGADTRLEEIFDLRVGAEELPRTFEDLADEKIQPVKVLVDYRTTRP